MSARKGAHEATGTLVWNLLTMPYVTKPAARKDDSPFINVHSSCGSRLNELSKCSSDCRGENPTIVTKDEIRKTTKGTEIRLTDAQIAAASEPNDRTMQVECCVNLEDVDPVYMGMSFHFGPADQAMDKIYALIARRLYAKNVAFFVKYMYKSHDKIGILRAVSPTRMMLHQLFWPEEIDSFESKIKTGTRSVNITPQEEMLADTWIEESLADFSKNVEGRRDGHKVRIEAIIQAAAEGAALPEMPPAEPDRAGTSDDNLLAMLQAGVAAAQAKKAPVKVEVPTEKAAKPKRQKAS